jgi:hypothetical protein
MKYGQNRRRYRAIATTERAAKRNEMQAAMWKTGAPEVAADYARIAREQREIIETLTQRVNFSDPRIHS